jgi:hypothetical protein
MQRVTLQARIAVFRKMVREKCLKLPAAAG